MVELKSVQLKLNLVKLSLKPIHAVRLISLYAYFRNKPNLIKKGFEQTYRSNRSISDALNIELDAEDPFEDLL